MPFLVLPENRFAHTAVETLVSSAAQERHAPVYLYGPSGSGKTLLLKQAAALFRRSHRQAIAWMVNAAEFSYPRGTSAELRQLESIDQSTGEVLVVFEDIQSLEGRSEAQRRLLAAGDELLGTGCRLIWTATKAPGELRGFLTRLKNRFRSGVLAGIKNPGRSSRGRLLEEFAATEKVPIGRDVVEFLARHSKNESPGELRAALHQALALSRQRKCEFTVELARQSVNQDACLPEPGLPQITRQVAREFGIAVAALCSEKRQRDLLVPRQVAMYLARTLTSASVKRIGRHFGGRSHTTVLHACDRVAEMLQTQADLRHRLRQIQAGLGRLNNADD